jgi:predicted nuclease with RNAse H fold
MLCVGIDVAEERKGLDLVALDDRRRVVTTLDRATITQATAMIAELRPDVVCIDSPPAWALVGRSRAAERELRRFGLTAFSTPTNPGPHAFYRWMRIGFSIFDAIADSHPRFRAGPVKGTAAEVFPEASAVLLEGRLRSAHETKAQFRRRVLASCGIDTSRLATMDSLDAALAALTGTLALEGEYSTVGEPDEGVILLPVSNLPTAKLMRASAVAMTPPTKSEERASPSASLAQVCECGCGATVRRRFLPGHDAKLKSRLRRLQKDGVDAARVQLRLLGWQDPVES